MKKTSILLALLLATCILKAQELEASIANHVKISLGMEHVRIRKAVSDKDYGISESAWALDASYWITNKWGVGINSDIILENFLVESHVGSHNSEIIERHFPVSVLLAGYYKPIKQVALIGGYGYELSREEDLKMLRVGLEYGYELPKKWEISATALYDVKFDTYDNWAIGFGVGKFFSLKKKHHHYHQ